MRLYFPSTAILSCIVWPGAGTAHSPGDPLGFICHMWMWDRLFWLHSCLAALPPCHCHTESSLLPLLISVPPTHLGEYSFFKSLVDRLPYSSICLHFWLFFILRLAVIILMVVQGGKVCLPMLPSWPEFCFFLTLFPTQFSYFYGHLILFLNDTTSSVECCLSWARNGNYKTKM